MRKLSQLVLLADTTSITRQGILLTMHGTGKDYSRKDIPGIFVRQNLKQQQQNKIFAKFSRVLVYFDKGPLHRTLLGTLTTHVFRVLKDSIKVLTL